MPKETDLVKIPDLRGYGSHNFMDGTPVLDFWRYMPVFRACTAALEGTPLGTALAAACAAADAPPQS